MTVALLPYTLVVLTDDHPSMERLSDALAAYDTRVIDTVDDAERVLRQQPPDAIIAPISPNTLRLFNRLYAHADLPRRPLLVLLTQEPCGGLPADFLIAPEWIGGVLPGALKLRRDQRAAGGDDQALVSERKRATEEISLLKNMIVRNVSHELKTPLLHVKSAVSLLADAKDEDRLKLVEYAMEATTRLESVVKNITQLADSLDIKYEPTRISDAYGYAVRSLRRSWQHKDDIQRIQARFDDSLPFVWADNLALGVVLQLLLDNALKFSKQDVYVEAVRRGSQVEIGVRDSGIGIAPDQLEKIFEPFYQIDGTDSKPFGGTGVGLALVRMVLERLNAPIRVESEVGVGSGFFFTLPCLKGESSPIL